MTDHKALESASETIKQIITLSTAVLGLSITFLKDIAFDAGTFSRCALGAGWVLYLLAIVFGVGVLMTLTGNLAQGKNDIYSENTRFLASASIASFVAAVLCTVVFGTVALATTSGTKSAQRNVGATTTIPPLLSTPATPINP